MIGMMSMYQIIENGQTVGRPVGDFGVALSCFLDYSGASGKYDQNAEGICELVRVFDMGQTIPMARTDNGELTYVAFYQG